jgi:hypothetical protein
LSLLKNCKKLAKGVYKNPFLCYNIYVSEVKYMKKTKLDSKELNKRCEEVFELQEDDYIYDVIVDDDNVVVNMTELDQSGQFVIFDYLPDMSERPEALQYLMGERDTFSD